MDQPSEGEPGAAQASAPVTSAPTQAPPPDRVASNGDLSGAPAPEASGVAGPGPDPVAVNGTGETHVAGRPEHGFPRHERNGRRHRRNRGRGRSRDNRGDTREPREAQAPPGPVVLTPSGDQTGWFDPQRDGGFLRGAEASYLTEPGDAYVPPQIVRQFGLRKADTLETAVGRDQRGRLVVMEIRSINGEDPATALRHAKLDMLHSDNVYRRPFYWGAFQLYVGS